MTKLLEEAIAKASKLGSTLSDQKQDRPAESILEALEDLEDAEEIKPLRSATSHYLGESARGHC